MAPTISVAHGDVLPNKDTPMPYETLTNQTA